MEYRIEGDNLQVVRISLAPGEEIYAEAGKMVYKTSNVTMESKMLGAGIGEKIFGALKRKVAGESLFTTHFSAHGNTGEVGFAGEFPGRIEAVQITPHTPFLAQKDAFICAQPGVELSIAFQKKIGAGFFGGEGFILEKFQGEGLVFIHAGGDFIHFDLEPKQEIEVDTGCVVGFSSTVEYDIRFVGGIKTALFGGEGLFLARLIGPGKVILQTMTLSKLRRELGVMATKNGGERSGMGALSDLVGGIFSSDD
jgi:uncharacterized protein (TIGR00266 family)